VIVVKVGGSLFDHPALGPGLRDFLQTLAPKEVLLVPGGGPVADAVRKLDRTHQLGEEAAHWLALRSLGVTTHLLESVLGLAREEPTPRPPPCREGEQDLRNRITFKGSGEVSHTLTPSLQGGGRGVGLLDAFAFAVEDESRPGALPHTWSVTTDSIAARAAVVFRAERLVLLKSVDVPTGTTWETAAANGWVDAHFPQIARTLACPVETVNFRCRLERP
jgi:hypothetical protein